MCEEASKSRVCVTAPATWWLFMGVVFGFWVFEYYKLINFRQLSYLRFSKYRIKFVDLELVAIRRHMHVSEFSTFTILITTRKHNMIDCSVRPKQNAFKIVENTSIQSIRLLMESGTFDGGSNRTNDSFAHSGLFTRSFWLFVHLKSKDYNINLYFGVVG